MTIYIMPAWSWIYYNIVAIRGNIAIRLQIFAILANISGQKAPACVYVTLWRQNYCHKSRRYIQAEINKYIHIHMYIYMYCTYAWVWQRPLDQSNSPRSISLFLSLSLLRLNIFYTSSYRNKSRDRIFTHTLIWLITSYQRFLAGA